MTKEALVEALRSYDGPAVKLMEVCGSHTAAIAKYGIRSLIAPQIELVSGPGCPVCVTEAGYIDRLWDLALLEQATICSFGDLLKVPGTKGSLSECKGHGGKIKIFYSPFDVLTWAKVHRQEQFIVAAVGFETTVPVYSLLVKALAKEELTNVRLLTALKCMPPVLEALYESENDVQGLIAPGHVAAVIGKVGFEPIVQKIHRPIAITGFGREEILLGIYDLVCQLQVGHTAVHNMYPRVVSEVGNQIAQVSMDEVFEITTAYWRGFGKVRHSGYRLRSCYSQWDAGDYEQEGLQVEGCQCHRIVRGELRPCDCSQFGKRCTPMTPLGPCMVSLEGACGVWYREGLRS